MPGINEDKIDKKFAQQLIVYSVIAAVVVYYLVAVYLPLFYGKVQSYYERKAILKAVAAKSTSDPSVKDDENIASVFRNLLPETIQLIFFVTG